MRDSGHIKRNNESGQTPPGEERILDWMRWILFAVIAGTSLLLALDVSDSTVLKPPVLFLGAALIVTLFLFRLFRSGRTNFTIEPAHWAVGAFLGCSLLSVLSAINLRYWMGSIFELSAYVVLFAAANALLYRENERQTLITVLLVVAALASLVGLAQAFLPQTSMFVKFLTERQIVSTFGNATYFAGFLVLVLPLALSRVIIHPLFSLRQILGGALVAIVVLVLFLTEARSAWIAAACTLGLFAVMNFKAPRTRWLIAGGMAAALLLLVLLFPDVIERRAGNLLNDPSSSFARRLFFYEGAWKAFLASPIIGNGAGNFGIFLPHFRSPEYWKFRSEDIVPHAHNEFLEILSETGVPGVCAFVLILGMFMVGTIRHIATRTGPQQTVAIGILCGIIAVLIDNLASMNLRTLPVAATFWILMGATLPHAAGGSSKSYSFALPIFVRKLRFVPLLLFGAFAFWYIPFAADRFLSERHFLNAVSRNWSGMPGEAMHDFRQVLSYNPHNAEARFYLAVNLMKEKRYEESRREVAALLAQQPFYPKAKLIDAVDAFELGDTTTALRELDEVLLADNGPLTLYYASYFAYHLKRAESEYTYVTTLLQRIIESGQPDYAVQAIGRLPVLCAGAARSGSCRTLLTGAVRAFPRDAGILTAAAEAYIQFGAFDEAQLALSQAVSLSPATDPALTTRLRALADTLSAHLPQTRAH